MLVFLYKILRRLNVNKYFNIIFQKRINNRNFKVPVIHAIGFENYYLSELWIIQVLEKINTLKKGSFYDVGVNTGQTLLKVKAVNPEISYLGFEPNSKCIFYVDELIKANSFINCSIIPVGLMAENALLKLNFFSDNNTDSSASLIENFRPDQKIYSKKFVPVFNFDTIDLSQDKVAILKIDVEGAEFFVLQSLLEKIKKDRPFILMEILPCYKAENISRIKNQKKIEEIFEELRYKIYRIILNAEKVTLEYVPKIEIHGNINLCEYFIIPAEMEKTIINKFNTSI
jgi:FkbM family methyltransferase